MNVRRQPKPAPSMEVAPATPADALGPLVTVLGQIRDQLVRIDPTGKRSKSARPVGVGPCDVLTVPEAVAMLGMREPEARGWLADHDLVHDVAGRERVIAGDLAEAIRGTGKKGPQARAVAPVRRLPLSTRV